MPYSDHTARRVTTTHDAHDTNGTDVRAIDEHLELPSFLGGVAHRSQMFTHFTPAISAHHITPSGIKDANALTTHVTLKNGVSSCIMDMGPGEQVGIHRTESIDHGAILHGSIWLIMPRGKATERLLLQAGDVFVQRGTSHGWESGPEGARMFTVMVDAEPVEVDNRLLTEFW